jgi:glucose/arabinose dehydrogenase
MGGVRTVGRVTAALAAALTAASCASSSSRAGGSGDGLVPIGAALRGPADLRASAYAHGPANLAALALDGQGRLWAATADSVDHGKDGLYVVTKPGAAPLEVVAGLHTPLGLLWYHESLYVASNAGVDAYRGFDGARFGQRRTIVTFPAGSGEKNGLALSPDGHMVLGISAPCDHCTPTSTWSATIVSFRPNGSDLRVDASGIRAPVGLAYYPQSSDLFVTINQRDDLGALTPGDWLAVVHPGQAWGFPACYGQGGPACRGVPKPVAVLDKHGAVIGLAIATGQLGPTVGTSAIVAEWAVGKVQRVTLRHVGPAYVGTVKPFLTGIKNPVPVLLGPDGALFVGDWATGTVYRIVPSTALNR